MKRTPPTLVTTMDAGPIVHLSAGTLRRLRSRGGGPRFIPGNPALYDVDDLTSWLESRKRRSTSDRGPETPATAAG